MREYVGLQQWQSSGPEFSGGLPFQIALEAHLSPAMRYAMICAAV
jgi:hypothetical protein